jgi:hypothetical protein
MKRLWLPLIAALGFLAPASLAQEMGSEPSAAPPPPAAPQPQVPAAPQPEGQWIYTDSYGWVWVPAGTVTVNVAAEPYVYLYTPSFGWTWYVSPWGWGPFFVGPWVHHPCCVARIWHGGRWVGPGVHVFGGGRYPGPPAHFRGGAHGGHYHGGHR